MKPEDVKRRRSMGKTADSMLPMQDIRQEGSCASSLMGLQPSTHLSKTKKACSSVITVTPPKFPIFGSKLSGLHILSLDMIVHECHEFYRACAELDDAVEWLSQVDPPNQILEKQDSIFYLRAIKLTSKLLDVLGITDGPFEFDVRQTLDHVNSIVGGPFEGIFEVRADVLAHDYRRIREELFHEIEKHKFLNLPSQGVTYFAQDRLFGDAVYGSFPSARYEIREGGNAIAFEMYTAAVFHFMRAAEVALRALARDRRISKLPKKRNAPIEMGTWEEIITELNGQAERICNWPNTLGEVKIQAQEFYNGSLTEYRGFKGKWRNHVMHTHHEYIREDAMSALEHVKRLMGILAGRISERKRTPLIWTKSQLR